MRVAQFSDLHYCEKHLRWVDAAFTHAVSHAIIERRADIAVISGDSFDSAIALHHPAVDALVRQVCRLADCMPVLILQGTFSHDRPGSLDVFKHIHRHCKVYVADQPGLVALAKDGHWNAVTADMPLLDHDRAMFTVLPSINRADFKVAGQDGGTDDVGRLIAQWGPANLAARAKGIPTVMVSHGTVNGCRTESHQAMVSPDHEFSTGTLFAAETSAVMLGHIHAHQSWEQDGRRIAYPGSITKLVYGHDEPTGYLLWQVDADKASFEFVPCPARELLQLDFDGPPDMGRIAEGLKRAAGAYVRICYSVDEEHRHSVDNAHLRALFEGAGAAEVKIEAHINPVVRTRATGIHAMPDVADKLRRWCELSTTTPEPLLQRLALLRAGKQPGARP